MTNTTQRLSYGESEHKEWPGGMAYVHIEGNFLHREGVSTSVELIHQPRRSDGVLELPRSVKTMRESGTYRIALTPGVYWFSASGPDGAPWSVRCRLDDASKKASKPRAATLEDRVEALEARLGKTGLNA